ncbi:hypothetical protein [Deinococcus hopiensis]|uniref:Uncharacterized protein n=1 Tax=Deinococcus hopiensis KR-140 TaxID=695939 RepID=A0A1W1UXJ1_9DEIO|nr:hypothetical protein [Deinococcus hopiensis]SMB85797.1 hypothetical protein SAMN00790413_03547 [Deinococcus hopiensis KR-140]
MATRAENAQVLKQELGLEIDTSGPDPKAPQLQGWADRLATEKDAVQKEVLTWQVQNTLDVELEPEGVTVEQLQNWLGRADTEREAVLAEINGGSNANDLAPTAPSATPNETVLVTVNSVIAGYGGTFGDPEQDPEKRVIGKEPLSVKLTHAVGRALVDGTLVLAE